MGSSRLLRTNSRADVASAFALRRSPIDENEQAMRADEERIRSECLEWASGALFPLSDVRVRDLVSRVCVDLDTWWRVIVELIEQAQ